MAERPRITVLRENPNGPGSVALWSGPETTEGPIEFMDQHGEWWRIDCRRVDLRTTEGEQDHDTA